MSEDNKDNNPEIIVPEIIESPELNDEVVESTPVAVKKGSFLSFLAFILAASALTVSAFLYMQLKNISEQPSVSAWQEPIESLEKNADQKFKQLSIQIKQMQKTNGELQEQLKTIETIATNIQPSENNGTLEKYDDSQLVEQLQALQNQMDNQGQALNQIKITVGTNNTKHNQAIQALGQKTNNPQSQTDAMTLINQNYQFEMAEYFLQAAHKHLNIYGNVEKGQEFLNNTIDQMSTLEGVEYQKLALKIKKVSDQLINNPPVDIPTVNKKIDQLISQSAQLNFDLSIKDESKNQQEQSSWYDKLIVIRKVDNKTDTKLTSTEKAKVYQDISNHFSMMKIALMSNKQTLWEEEIMALESLLDERFASQSNGIKGQLTELKTLGINPKLPDLSGFLEALQALNNNQFTQLEVPMESKLTIKSTTDTNENK